MMKLKITSILYKILFILILASFFQGILTIYMSYDLTQKTLYSQINDSGLNYIESNSRTIGMWLSGKMNEISLYSRTSEVRSMDWDKMESYLKDEVSRKLDIYDHIFVADTSGNYNTTLKRDAGTILDRSYFKLAMEGKTVVSEPMISKTTGNQMAVIATPIKNEKGEIIGLIGGSLNLVKLYQFIDSSSFALSTSYSYIIDKNGTILTHPDKSYIMKENISIKSSVIGDSLIKASPDILNNNRGLVEYTYNGEKSLNYFNTIPNTDGWKAIIKIPVEYLETPLATASRDLSVIGLIGLIFSAIIAVFVSRSISHPIIELNNAFTRASKGDLNVRASNDSRDEIGRAAQGFNKMMETISNLTYYDTLTGLPNKLQFIDRLSHEIADCNRDNEKLAVIIYDIDKFETINDALGHSAGDSLLKHLALHITELLDENEIACRLGEDRFALLLPNNPQVTYAIRTSLKLLEIAKKPWEINSHTFHITASIGIAFYPDDGEDCETLLKNALSAMLRAKKSGRGNYQLYDSKASTKLLDLIELDNYMHHALEKMNLLCIISPK